MIAISSNFDGGNVTVVNADDPGDIRLEIRKDNESHFYQWFFFRVVGGKGRELTLNIENGGGAAYPDGWPKYRALASSDLENWRRVDTDYGDGVLTVCHRPDRDVVWYAYFVPYTMERHHGLIARCNMSDLAHVERLGSTLDGQDIDLVRFGSDAPEALKLWLIARQHPGETMAEWWMEGCLERLMDPSDPVAKALRQRCAIYVVPNMNPDGSRRGHLRTNAVGANLNREWRDATMERSPEVYLVRQRMLETGVDFHMDVHGDEAIPHVFTAGFEGIPNLRKGQQELLTAFQQRLAAITPDFQTTHGYPPDAPGSADLRKCTDYVAETFGAVAMTLEMPFKDHDENPDPVEGWSPARSRQLARSCLEAITDQLDALSAYRQGD